MQWNHDRGKFRRPINANENMIFFFALLCGHIGSVITLLIAIGSKVEWSVLYIGYPIWCAICLVCAFAMWRLSLWLERSRFDKQLTCFAGAKFAETINKWLLCLTINFVHEPGAPKRWHDYMCDVERRRVSTDVLSSSVSAPFTEFWQ